MTAHLVVVHVRAHTRARVPACAHTCVKPRTRSRRKGCPNTRTGCPTGPEFALWTLGSHAIPCNSLIFCGYLAKLHIGRGRNRPPTRRAYYRNTKFRDNATLREQHPMNEPGSRGFQQRPPPRRAISPAKSTTERKYVLGKINSDFYCMQDKRRHRRRRSRHSAVAISPCGSRRGR